MESLEITIQEAVELMTEGQRQHMANKLNKLGYRPQNLSGRHVEVSGKEYILVPVEV